MAHRPTVRQPVKPIQPRPEAEDDEPSQGLPEAPEQPPPEAEGPKPPEAEEGPKPPEHLTIADEQRARSLEIERMGATAYMAQFDTRKPEDTGKAVQGVGNTQVDERELRRR
jgi:hypothetical protein